MSVRPTKADLRAAYGRTVPDLARPGLAVLFCGINPSLYSAAVGCHFARPGNRFWPALHGAGFTDRRLTPFEGEELLRRGYGITNLVARATASASELTTEEFIAGGRALRRKARRYQPRWLAVLGVGAYRAAFSPRAAIGPQPESIGPTRLWVLPNPSGLNAHYQLAGLVEEFRRLRAAAEKSAP